MHRVARRRLVHYAVRWRSMTTSGLMAGLTLVLLGPAAAVSHADGLDWDAIAECESGGDWDADTGNGFYGGLQFKESTWKEFGGKGSPAKASKSEQIAVANRVLAGQGIQAWPTCGPANAAALWRIPLRNLAKTLWSSIPH